MATPTKYKDEILSKTIEYTDNFGDYGHAIPSVEGLADVLKIQKASISDWAENSANDEFTKAMNMLSNRQHLELINKGLSGAFNETVVKLILINNHGYKDKKFINANHNHDLKEPQNYKKSRLYPITAAVEATNNEED